MTTGSTFRLPPLSPLPALHHLAPAKPATPRLTDTFLEEPSLRSCSMVLSFNRLKDFQF